MHKSKFFIDPMKMTISLITFIFLFAISISLITIERYGSAFVFGLVSLLFLYHTAVNGCRIYLKKEGVYKKLLGIQLAFIAWEDVLEVGIIGEKIFDLSNGRRSGPLYIYLSREVMTEDDRFQMVLNWPPKDKLYLHYMKARLDYIQFEWNGKIETYNAEKSGL